MYLHLANHPYSTDHSMSYPTVRINWFIKRCYWVLLIFFTPCYAQTSKVAQLQLKVKHPQPDTARLKLLQQLTEAYSSVDPVKKFYYANVYKALAQKLHNGQAVADAYVSMGISYGIRSKLDSALYYFTLAYKQAEKSKYPLGMGRSLANIGYAYDRLDDKKESVQSYLQALEIFKKFKYQHGINQCNINIGAIYYDLGQYKIALSYFSECLKNSTDSKDEPGIAYGLYNVGNCYQSLGQDDKALDCFNKSLAIRDKQGDLNGSGLAQMGLGIVYLHKKQYNSAITHLQIALKNMRTLQDKYQENAVLNHLADVYVANKQYELAKGCAMQALNIGHTIKSKVSVSDALERLVSVYKGENDLAKAFKYQSEYISIEDSILVEKSLKDVTLTEISRIRSENENLTINNQLISSKNTSYLARLNKYSNVIVATSIILGSVTLLLVILYRRNLEKQATNKLLLQQKNEIANINKELETLNEEVNAQMELTNAQNIELERLNDIKNKFFSIVSHDLRSPLSTLQSLFSIYREGDIGEEELGMLLAKLEDTILSTGAFLDNLLEWAKSQLEGIVITPVNFNVGECILENIHLFESKVGLKNLTVINQAIQPVMVHADRNMINLVIRNLLSNSIKFCAPGDEITLSAELKDGKALIAIRDTGPGISETDRDKLFNLEHTLSTGTQGEKGNHLGLILCRDMVVQNNGHIWFETQYGEGTTFWVELPIGS
jgi:signal transduction histidine kinase/Tfp pilus assembly protein PilF